MRSVSSLIIAIAALWCCNSDCLAEDPWFPQPERIITLPIGNGGIYSSASGQLVYVGSRNPSLYTGDLKRSRLSLDFLPIGSLNQIGITGDDEFIAGTGKSGLFVIDIRRKKLFPCEQLPGESDSLALSPKDSLIAITHQVKGVKTGCILSIWNASTRKKLYFDEISDLNSTVLAFNNKGTQLAYAASKEIVIVDIATQQIVFRAAKKRSISRILWAEDDLHVLCLTGSVGILSKDVLVYWTSDSQNHLLLTLPDNLQSGSKLQWNSKQRVLYGEGHNGNLCEVRVTLDKNRSHFESKVFPAHSKNILSVFYEKELNILVTCGSDQRIIFWNCDTMAPLITYRHAAEVGSLWMSKRSPKLFLRYFDKCYVFDRKDVLPATMLK